MDEGMKKIARNLSLMLSRDHRILTLDLKHIHRRSFWTKLRSFKPEIVFYVPGPSLFSFVIAKALWAYCHLSLDLDPKVVMFASHPDLTMISDRVCSIIKPDLLLVQSLNIEERFYRLHLRQRFLPNGVDTKQFVPVNSSHKIRARKKYGLADTFLILHVGPIRKNRGLEILTKVPMEEGNQVLVVGSTSMPMDRVVYKMLTNAGCLVWRQYFKEIEEIYQLADVYVFPVLDMDGSIQLPLSVMEAMACNLPVISTKFGALPRIFKQGNGLIFVDRIDEIPAKINQIKSGYFEVKTREKVMPYSWEGVSRILNEYFYEVLQG